jgi:eukaryotic-like serine/threonine-protein kinase
MSLAPGTRLGPYEILSAIGAGGMGEVYKARDTRLGRTVAIKVLPAGVASDPERRRRFEQEARAVSALNHPHICVLHDIGREGDTDFLVMEHLEGQTLAERLAKGPLRLDQALQVGVDVAGALAAAHKQGITHRDLKPGNVMLTETGAKLLDFGLARLTNASDASGASVTLSTVGTIVGTVPYMAPEQVEGRPTDARTDIFAFGTVLYEMLTGRRAFEGDSQASIMAAVLEHEPEPLSAHQPLVPPVLERLVARCLAKNPDHRWDSAHDVADDLRWIRDTCGVGAAVGVRRRRGLSLTAAGGLGLFAAGLGVMWLLRPLPPETRAARQHLNWVVSPAEELNGGGFMFPLTPAGSSTAFTWTPDGQALVFVGRRAGVQQLYVRELDAAEARPIPGTENAQTPAVSSDGQSVAFWTGGAIRKVRLDGADLMEVASAVKLRPARMVWDSLGRLLFDGAEGRIWKVSVGGVPAPVTTLREDEAAHFLPWPLPSGQALLFALEHKGSWGWRDAEVVVETLATGARKPLLKDAADARYVPTGHLVFLRRGTLFAVPFDADRLEIRGTPEPVLPLVAQALTGGNEGDETGAGQFAFAATGMLAWVRAEVVQYPAGPLVTVDRSGNVAALPESAKPYAGPVRVSPDGRRLAASVLTLTERGLWVYDIDQMTLTPLSQDVAGSWGIWWPPDGRRLVFGQFKGGQWTLSVQPADGSASARSLLPGQSRPVSPVSFTPDGRQLLGVRDGDIVVVTIENGQARVEPGPETREIERAPEVSPDGRRLAFTSNKSGRDEVYVRPYPGPGAVEQVSVDGGTSPAWSPAGGELFFLRRKVPVFMGTMMVVDVVPGRRPRHPRSLFDFNNRDLGFDCIPARCYDVAPNGQRFHVTRTPTQVDPPKVTHLDIIPNWFEELKAKVPVKR